MNHPNQDHERPLSLSRLLFLLTVHRRLRGEMLADLFTGNFSKIGKKAVLYFSLLKADYFLRRGLRDMSDDLYDLEFGCLPSLERRIYECIVSVDAHIRWMDEQENSGRGSDGITF